MVNQRMQEMILQMKLQNQSLQQQNELLQSQISKSDLINSARTTKVQPGAKKSPKKRGGMIEAKRGKEKRFTFAQSNGVMMRGGGSCGLKRSKRR